MPSWKYVCSSPAKSPKSLLPMLGPIAGEVLYLETACGSISTTPPPVYHLVADQGWIVLLILRAHTRLE